MLKFSDVLNESVKKFDVNGSVTINFNFNNIECNSDEMLKDYIMSILEQNLLKGQIYNIEIDESTFNIDLKKRR